MAPADDANTPRRTTLDEPLLYRVPQLADLCGVSEKTVRRWISEQGLPSVRLAAAGARETTFVRPTDFRGWVAAKNAVRQPNEPFRPNRKPRYQRRFL